MNAEKMLNLVNEAISYADEEQRETIRMMRKNGTREVPKNWRNVNSGAFMEELRCALMDEIEAAECKKSGKSKYLTAIKKFSKNAYKEFCERKPLMAYAWKNPETGVNYVCNGYVMVETEHDEGLQFMENARDDEINNQVAYYKKLIPSCFEKESELPEFGKLVAWYKNEKQNISKRETVRFFHKDVFALNAEMLIEGMKLTDARKIAWNKHDRLFCLKGDSVNVYIMPIKIDVENFKPSEV